MYLLRELVNDFELPAWLLLRCAMYVAYKTAWTGYSGWDGSIADGYTSHTPLFTKMIATLKKQNKTEKTFSLKRLLNPEKHFEKMQLLKMDAYDLAYAVAYIVVYAVAFAFASTFAYEVNYAVAYVVTNTIAYSVAYADAYVVAYRVAYLAAYAVT